MRVRVENHLDAILCRVKHSSSTREHLGGLTGYVSFLVVGVLAAVGCNADDAPSSTEQLSLPTSPKAGVATFYDYSGGAEVACGFGIGPDVQVAAMNLGEYATAAACGSCLDVVGPKGRLKVRVVDSCPGCDGNQIDLSAEAFAKVAEPRDGRVAITYKVARCDVSGAMSYRFKEGSSSFWTAIQIRDHRLPIAKVEYSRNGTYVSMPRTDYNYFVESQGVGEQRNGLSLRVTATDGQVVEETLPAVVSGRVVAGTKQFQ